MPTRFTLCTAGLLLTILLAAGCSSSLEGTPTAGPTRTGETQPAATETATGEATPSATAFTPAERIPVIEYHHPTFAMGDSVTMTEDWFREQMAWLHDNGYETLTSAELSAFLDGQAFPQKSVVLTFDLGLANRSEYAEIVIPLLREYGQHAIFFMLANPDVVVENCGEEDKFCWSELRQWAEEGLISLGSHGINHPDYQTISIAVQRQDAGDSRTLIENQTGQAVLGFAFPYDSVNSQSGALLESLGYRFAVAGYSRDDRSVYWGDESRYALPRVYPYSSQLLYPVLSSANGLTFPEMIAAQTALIGLDTPEPPTAPAGTPATPASTALPTRTAAAASPEPIDLTNYAYNCRAADAIGNIYERLNAINQLTFPTDLSAAAQSGLALPVVIRPSCNLRAGNTPQAVVLHSTRGTLESSINKFQEPGSSSSHYIIDRSGQVYQVVPEALSAFHVTCYGLRSNCVESCPICGTSTSLVEPYTLSVGIELVNRMTVDPDTFEGLVYEDYLMSFGYRYWEDYPETQLQALVTVVDDIRARWGIPLGMVLGHYQVNTNSDPGPALNLFWERYGNPRRGPIFPAP